MRYGPAGRRPLPYEASIQDGAAHLPRGPGPLDVLVFGAGAEPVLLEQIQQDQVVELEPMAPVAVTVESLEALGVIPEDHMERRVVRLQFEPLALDHGELLPEIARAVLMTTHDPLGIGAEIRPESSVQLPLPGRWTVRASLVVYRDTMFRRDPPEARTPTIELPVLQLEEGGAPPKVEVDVSEILAPEDR